MKVDQQIKRAKLTAAFDSMDSDSGKFGRKIRVFETSSSNSPIRRADHDDPPDDFYDLKPEDYYRLTAKKGEDRNYLKTRKIREAEAAARRSKISRSTIRVRFPDNYTLEAVFQSSEKIQTLFDLVKKTIRNPDDPFYLYTTPPKKQLKEKDYSQDFNSAGFIPGAIVYFAYDLGMAAPAGSFLSEEVMALQGLEMVGEPEKPDLSSVEPMTVSVTEAASRLAIMDRKPASKMTAKPKWLKL